MTKHYLLLLFLGFACTMFGQETLQTASVKAQPPADMVVYAQQINENLQIPDSFFENIAEDKLPVKITFFVQKDGQLLNIKVQDDEYGFTPFVKSAMEKLPVWTPQIENGKAVSSRQSFTINVYNSIYNNPYFKPAVTPIPFEAYNKKLMKKLRISEKDWAVIRAHSLAELTVIARFDVTEEGKLENLRIENQIKELDRRFYDAFKGMPDWIPATLNGKPVRSKQFFPITIIVNWYYNK